MAVLGFSCGFLGFVCGFCKGFIYEAVLCLLPRIIIYLKYILSLGIQMPSKLVLVCRSVEWAIFIP